MVACRIPCLIVFLDYLVMPWKGDKSKWLSWMGGSGRVEGRTCSQKSYFVFLFLLTKGGEKQDRVRYKLIILPLRGKGQSIVLVIW